MSKPKKKRKVKKRVPVAPPSKRHKSKKDYRRKKKVDELTIKDRESDESDEGDWSYAEEKDIIQRPSKL